MADGDNTATNALDPNSLAALLQQTMTPNPDVQQQASPMGGELQAPPPTQQPQVSSTPPRSNQPPRMGGMPLIAQYIQGMIKGGTQGGIGPSGYPQQPTSRGDMTLNFLGQFLGNLAQGLSQAGHGPGANLRGFGAAVQAPYQRSLQDFQVQQQAQEQQARIAQQQAQTELAQAQAGQYKNLMQTPLGPMSPALAMRLYPEMIRSQTQKEIAGERITSAEDLKKLGIQAQKELAGQKLAQQLGEFKQTQEYRIWKEKLDKDTQLKVANITAGKAPAQMLQTAAYADGGLTMMADAKAAMDRLEARGVMGSSVAQNKVENWIFGKGLVDPSLPAQDRADIGKLRAALGYTSSAAMRAHTGRTSQEIYQDFKDRLGAGQDWTALKGAMEETDTLLSHYRDAASTENIQRLRGGTSNVPQPKKGGSKVDDLVGKYGGKP